MNLVNSLMALVCVLILSSCGAIDSMGRMEEYSKNMDQKMDKTVDGINKTNGGMDKTIEGIDKTNVAVHKQVLTVAMEQMLSPENSAFLSPPIGMLPAAKIFAEEATAHELLQVVHTAYMEAKIGFEDIGEQTAEQLAVHRRSVKWAMAGALAAFATDEQFAEIQKEVEVPGRYQGTAKVFAVARYNMIKTAFLEPLRADASARNLGGLKVALKYYQSMKKVADLPYFKAQLEAIPTVSAFTVTIPKVIKEVTEVPNPSNANENNTVVKYVNKVETVDSSSDANADIYKRATLLKSAFGKVEGEEAKALLEQFN